MVPVKDGMRLMAGPAHRHAFRNASIDHVARGGAPHIGAQSASHAGRLAGSGPCSAEVFDARSTVRAGKVDEEKGLSMPSRRANCATTTARTVDVEYDDYQKLAGNLTKIDGLGMHDRLKQLVAEPEYKNDSDAIKAITMAREINAFKRAALEDLMEKHAGIGEAFDARLNAKERTLEAPARAQPTARSNGGYLLKYLAPRFPAGPNF